MLADSHKNIIKHNQANKMSSHYPGKIVQDEVNMRSNLEASSDNSYLHTEHGDKVGDSKMIVGLRNETDQ
ncbi:hypothetical protein D5086_022656 [Populus alba]|uniref:Uncharacterized protein n=1 Tax=Populus alba TaxID=43335 RepID=A0ACC4BFL6_POPAL